MVMSHTFKLRENGWCCRWLPLMPYPFAALSFHFILLLAALVGICTLLCAVEAATTGWFRRRENCWVVHWFGCSHSSTLLLPFAWCAILVGCIRIYVHRNRRINDDAFASSTNSNSNIFCCCFFFLSSFTFWWLNFLILIHQLMWHCTRVIRLLYFNWLHSSGTIM